MPGTPLRSAAVLLLAASASAQDLDKLAFVEMKTDREAYFIGQPVRLTVRFGFEQDFLDHHLLKVFQGPITIPVQLQISWWDDLAGAKVLPEVEPTSDDLVSFARNGKFARAARVRETRGGRKFTVLEIRRSYVPRRAGSILFPAPKIQFGYAMKFRDDFLHGRVPIDGRTGTVSGSPRRLPVRAVPANGRESFTGAIGSFTIRATASPTELAVGDGLKLTLRIAGEGNLSEFAAPSLKGIEGFHPRGAVDDRGTEVRTIIYDLLVGRQVAAFPRLPFEFFRTDGEPGFRTIHTDAIPLSVRPLPPGKTLDLPGGKTEASVPGENDIFDLKPANMHSRLEFGSGLAPHWMFLLFVIPWLAALGVRSLWRARRVRREPNRLRARGAAAAYHARVIDSGEDAADALSEYIAARLHVKASAVIGPGLPSQLVVAGASEELAARTAKVLEDLVAARYGGAADAATPADAEALVAELESAFGKN